MLNRVVINICLFVVFIAAPYSAVAGPVITFGSGSAVSSTDLFASFDTLATSGHDLNNYAEGGLNVRSVSPYNDGLSFACDGCIAGSTSPLWYVNGGMYDGYLSISTVAEEKIYATEFLVGSGWGRALFNIYWESYTGSALSGSGSLFNVESGPVLGFADAAGFDELRLGAYFFDPGGSFVGSTPRPNAIAIDDLRVQVTPVPEPATGTVLLTGLAMLAIARRRNTVK